MIDWLSSKVAMTLAAFLLLAGMAGFFLAQRERIVHDSLQGIADLAAEAIHEIGGAGETAVLVTLGEGGSIELPALAAGKPYVLVIHPFHVVAAIDPDRVFSPLHVRVHLWEPKAGTYSPAQVEDLDARHPALTVGTGGSFLLSARSLWVDGSQRLEVFVFL